MKAVWYEKYGEAKDVLKCGELPNPEPTRGEVLVRTSFSGVNPSDVKRRKGQTTTLINYPKIIPHNDGAGMIEKLGAGVSTARVGQRVWIYEAQLNRPFGTAAEYVAIPEELAVPLPDNATLEMGASLGVPAMTAHRCVFSEGSVKEKTILVRGGAGAVGNFAVQLAKWGGAKVISTVSSSQKAAVASRAGANHVINYKTEDVIQRILEITNGEGVDRVIEVALGTNLMQNIKVLKPGGVIASYASEPVREPIFPFYSLFTKNPVFNFVLVYTMSKEAHKTAISDINKCLEKKVLSPNIAKIYALQETPLAHEDVEKGSLIGKALIRT